MIGSTVTVIAANAAVTASHAGSTAGLSFSPAGILFLKALFVIALIGMVVGGWCGKRIFGGWGDAFFGSLLGFCMFPSVAFFVFGFVSVIVSGIYWVFTA